MKSPRITPRERGLLKGAIRRVFSRSELRRSALTKNRLEHQDPKRPRVKKWSYCSECGEVTPEYLMQVDHIDPVIPVHTTFEEIGADETIDRTWCAENNLTPLCKPCHSIKTKEERKRRNEQQSKRT